MVLSLGNAVLWAQQEGQRYALVIGNANYVDVGKLKNPVNDARDMSETLKKLNFTVDLVTDADLPTMEASVDRFGERLSIDKEAIGFFFYAGHGVQSGGANYLIPVDAHVASEPYLRTKALPMQVVLDILQNSQNSLNILVLDACRDNPFSWGRSMSRGLSVVGNQPPGSIVTYATSVGSIAQDGEGRNGVFTSELLKNLGTPGLDIMEVFQKTGAGVQAATGGAQIPAIYSQYFGKIYLAGESQGGESAFTQPAMSPKPAAQASMPAPPRPQDSMGKISFSWLPDAATVALDGARIIFPSPTKDGELIQELPSKKYQLAVTLPDAGVYTGSIAIQPGQTLSIPRPTSFIAAGYEDAKAKAIASYRKAKGTRVFGLVSIGTGTALAIGGGISYFLGERAYASYAAATTQAGADDYRTKAQTWQNLFWGGLIGGVSAISLGALIDLGAPKTQPLEASIKDLDARIIALSAEGNAQ
jgi:hypothetical protein